MYSSALYGKVSVQVFTLCQCQPTWRSSGVSSFREPIVLPRATGTVSEGTRTPENVVDTSGSWFGYMKLCPAPPTLGITVMIPTATKAQPTISHVAFVEEHFEAPPFAARRVRPGLDMTIPGSGRARPEVRLMFEYVVATKSSDATVQIIPCHFVVSPSCSSLPATDSTNSMSVLCCIILLFMYQCLYRIGSLRYILDNLSLLFFNNTTTTVPLLQGYGQRQQDFMGFK